MIVKLFLSFLEIIVQTLDYCFTILPLSLIVHFLGKTFQHEIYRVPYFSTAFPFYPVLFVNLYLIENFHPTACSSVFQATAFPQELSHIPNKKNHFTVSLTLTKQASEKYFIERK